MFSEDYYLQPSAYPHYGGWRLGHYLKAAEELTRPLIRAKGETLEGVIRRLEEGAAAAAPVYSCHRKQHMHHDR